MANPKKPSYLRLFTNCHYPLSPLFSSYSGSSCLLLRLHPHLTRASVLFYFVSYSLQLYSSVYSPRLCLESSVFLIRVSFFG